MLFHNFRVRFRYSSHLRYRGLFLYCSPPPGGHRATNIVCLDAASPVIKGIIVVWLLITFFIQLEPVAMALWRPHQSISVME